MVKFVDELERLDEQLKDLRIEVKNAKSVEELELLQDKISKLTNDRLELNNKNNKVEVSNNMEKYVGSHKEVKDFVEVFRNSRDVQEAIDKYRDNLRTNGVTVKDDKLYLPKRIVTAIETTLTQHNDVFPLFKVTNFGALIALSELTSDEGARVHTMGEQKTEQSANLSVSSIQPVIVYKLQSLHEISRRTLNDFDELLELIISELSQAIIDKIVDLALVEGTATGVGSGSTENGFTSIKNETNNKRVKKFDGQTDLIGAIEEAVDFVTDTSKKYLVITNAQKRSIIKALRTAHPTTRYRNDLQDLAMEFGVDGVVIYRGKASLDITVLAQDAYLVDMDDITQVRAFEWKTNEHKVLLEAAASGRIGKHGGAAVVTVG